MNIDEAAFERLFGGRGHEERAMARQHIDRYLSALPSAEPGRDRIAVVVDREGEFGCWKADEDDVSNPGMWEELEENAKRRADAHPPFARAIIRCNLPRPAEPVEVEGSVEGVP